MEECGFGLTLLTPPARRVRALFLHNASATQRFSNATLQQRAFANCVARLEYRFLTSNVERRCRY